MRSYQDEDVHLLDYGLVEIPGLDSWGACFRGPAPTRPGYVAFLGAAQTFGRLCAYPYPSLLAQQLGIEVLNLGHGGAGPEFFLRSGLLSAVDDASVVVIQVMSARSQSTEHFRSNTGLMSGQRVSDGKPMVPEEFFEDLCRSAPADIPDVVRAFQHGFERSMETLTEHLYPRPVVLFWFSVQRPPDGVRTQGGPEEILGTFPHFVTREMVERLRGKASAYVECCSSEGLPRRIVDSGGLPSRFVLDYRLTDSTQYVVEYDSYYPSPEMHIAAASQLAPVLEELL